MGEMLRSGDLPLYLLVIPVVYIPILFAVIILAKAKDRSILTATLLGIIPFINFYILLVYVGLPQKKTSSKEEQS